MHIDYLMRRPSPRLRHHPHHDPAFLPFIIPLHDVFVHRRWATHPPKKSHPRDPPLMNGPQRRHVETAWWRRPAGPAVVWVLHGLKKKSLEQPEKNRQDLG